MDNMNENNISEETEEIIQEEPVSSWKTGWKKELRDWIEAIVIAVVVALVLRNFVLTLALVDGASMERTLSHGDRLYVNKVFYSPEKGDIVIIDTEKHPQGPLVKRVIATEGDTIYIDRVSGMVYVNDELLEEDYIKGKTVLPVQKDNLGIVRGYYGELAEIFADPSYSRQNPIKLGEGEVFAMGDNRENSSDSRNLGIFTEDEIMGHAVFRFWPFNKIEMLD